jgi:hypothetical protein
MMLRENRKMNQDQPSANLDFLVGYDKRGEAIPTPRKERKEKKRLATPKEKFPFFM